MMVGAAAATVTVNVQGAVGKLDAWIDFNGDGAWGGPGEQIFAARDVIVGDNLLTFDVPSYAIAGTTYARFRVSTAGALGVIGAAADGEVEDYQVNIVSPTEANGIFGAPYTISPTADGASSIFAADVDGDGDLDVLSASADDSVGFDTITFDMTLEGGTILLAMGELKLTKTFTLDATSLVSGFTIDAQEGSRIFNITATSGDFTLAGFTLTGGTSSSLGGGSIRSVTSGHLTIDQSIITGNHTTGSAAQGGGVHASNGVTISNSTIGGNHTEGINGLGGGISSANGSVQ
ncbi:MAG: GEVED domain-containing protein [Pirellulales bacterium]